MTASHDLIKTIQQDLTDLTQLYNDVWTKDTRHLSVLIDHHQISETSRYTCGMTLFKARPLCSTHERVGSLLPAAHTTSRSSENRKTWTHKNEIIEGHTYSKITIYNEWTVNWTHSSGPVRSGDENFRICQPIEVSRELIGSFVKSHLDFKQMSSRLGSKCEAFSRWNRVHTSPPHPLGWL